MRTSTRMLLTAVVASTLFLAAIPATSNEPAGRRDLAGLNTAEQALALGGLLNSGHLSFLEFTKVYGEKSEVILAARLAKQKTAIEKEADAAYRQTFSKEELEALSAFYQTKQGRMIARKFPYLYPRLAVIGAKYSADALSTK